jgi:hypothetical protein
MKKIKNPFQQISKGWISAFSANILGVIIGIALTFGISALVQQYSDRKQVKEMLALLENEVRLNREWLEKTADFYQRDKEAYQFFLANDSYDSIPQDTLLKYVNQVCTWTDTYLGTEVWDVFQNLGMAQKLHNPELVSRLASFYFAIGKIKALWDDYNIKRQVVWTTIAQDKDDDGILEPLQNNKDCFIFMKLAKTQSYVETIEFHYPFADYILYSIENYKNPAKFAIDYDAFVAMQKDEK